MNRIIFIFLFFLFAISPAIANVIELPKCISSDMIVQRDKPIQLWGWTKEKGTMHVKLVRDGNEFSAESEIDKNGKWLLTLAPQLVCCTPCKLIFEIEGVVNSTLELSNILIGDVWFAGGQSNMEKKVNHLLDLDEIVAEAQKYSQIRSFKSSYNLSTTPQDKIQAEQGWFECEGDNLLNKTSAVAYVFALNVHKQTGVPIGILQSYRGGTEAETWMSETIIKSEKELIKVKERLSKADPNGEKLYRNYPTINFNGQIHPLQHFPIKGFLFYQGESNTKRALEYSTIMEYLIKDWRKQWDRGDLPFYYVQLFNIGTSASDETLYEENNWSDLREQQSQLLDKGIPSVWMAVSIDTNEDPRHPEPMVRIHPKNKKPIGERLALLALKNTYGIDTLASSPSYSHSYIEGRSIYVVMINVGGGLKTRSVRKIFHL